jgi:hypothetical protein
MTILGTQMIYMSVGRRFSKQHFIAHYEVTQDRADEKSILQSVFARLQINLETFNDFSDVKIDFRDNFVRQFEGLRALPWITTAVKYFILKISLCWKMGRRRSTIIDLLQISAILRSASCKVAILMTSVYSKKQNFKEIYIESKKLGAFQ